MPGDLVEMLDGLENEQLSREVYILIYIRLREADGDRGEVIELLQLE